MSLSIKLGFLSMMNVGLAFLFQWYIFTKLGSGVETDALFAGMTIPQLILAMISGSLMHVLVPLLSGEKKEQINDNAWRFSILIGGLFGLLAIFLLATATWWVPLIVPGFSNESHILTIKLTRIQLMGMIFNAINGVQWAVYHAKQKFIWVELSQIITHIFAILLLYYILPRSGVTGAAWITIMRMGFQTILLLPVMGRPVFSNLMDPTLAQAWKKIKPLLIGNTYYKTEPVVDRFLLSNAASGGLSLYYLAQQMYGALNRIINKSITTPLVPTLSILYKSKSIDDFKRLYLKKLTQVFIMGLVVLLILIFGGQKLLTLLIGHGNITDNNINELWLILICLIGVLAGGALGQISSSSFYAIGDTITITRISIFTYTINIPLKILSYFYFGILGLAVSSTIYYLVNFLIQNYLLLKRL